LLETYDRAVRLFVQSFFLILMMLFFAKSKCKCEYGGLSTAHYERQKRDAPVEMTGFGQQEQDLSGELREQDEREELHGGFACCVHGGQQCMGAGQG
jgi:hypothetical protein